MVAGITQRDNPLRARPHALLDDRLLHDVVAVRPDLAAQSLTPRIKD